MRWVRRLGRRTVIYKEIGEGGEEWELGGVTYEGLCGGVARYGFFITSIWSSERGILDHVRGSESNLRKGMES